MRLTSERVPVSFVLYVRGLGDDPARFAQSAEGSQAEEP